VLQDKSVIRLGIFDIDPGDIYSYDGLHASIPENRKGKRDKYGFWITHNDEDIGPGKGC
jgi:hypothetical protein